ncbi:MULTISPECIES: restriction endonuclease subunit S, partial [Terrabacteria group]|uniref:restriction endonuclease subunit S n=1 Tax=Bacillati TaxID=1783272 RepID=UPI001C6E7651
NNNLEQQVQTLFRNQFLTQEFLPDGWTRATLGEVSLMGAGGDKPKTVSATQTENCPYPIYSNGISDEGLYGFTNEYKIKDESITVSARGTIGFVCLRHIPYTPIVRLVTLIPKTDVLSAKYLYLWLRNTHIHGTGTTQQQLTVPDFRKTEIILPTKEEMTSFTDTITPFFEAIWENQAQNLKFSNTRDALLPKLMSGELDVSNINF